MTISVEHLVEMITQTAVLGRKVRVYTVEGVTLFDVYQVQNGQFSGVDADNRKRIRFNIDDVAAVTTYESYKKIREKEKKHEAENKKYKGLGDHIKKETGTLD